MSVRAQERTEGAQVGGREWGLLTTEDDSPALCGLSSYTRATRMAARSFSVNLTQGVEGIGPGGGSPAGPTGEGAEVGPVGAAGGAALHRALREAALPRPTGGLVFVAGSPTGVLRSVARQVAEGWPGVPSVIVPGAGILSEEGEIEGTSAASGLVWGGGSVEPFHVDAPDLGEGIAAELEARVGDSVATVILFVGSQGLEPGDLGVIGAAAPKATIFGAGAVRRAIVVVGADGEIHDGAAAGLILRGLGAPIVEASPACRILSAFATVDKVEGGLVLEVGGEAALDALSACSSKLRGGEARPVVFAALADDADPTDDAPRYLVRPIRGIDPTRRAVMVGPDARPGARLAWGVRDPQAARVNLETTARKIDRGAQGAAPRFAVYVNCAGRGHGLYGAPDVDVRILKKRFPGVPIVGMHSSFEISSSGPGKPRLQMFSGVVALFRSLS